MKEKAIILDFDGTIADTFPNFVRAVNQTFEKWGREPIEDHEPFREIHAKEGIRKLGVRWYKLPFFMKQVKSLVVEWTLHAKVHKGMKKALRKLHKKYSIIIVTSNGTKVVTEFMSQHKIPVDMVKGDIGLFSKSRVLRRLGRRYDVVSYVGDEARDIEAARKAKVKAIAVTWGFNSKEMLESHAPDLIITSAEQLEKL